MSCSLAPRGQTGALKSGTNWSRHVRDSPSALETPPHTGEWPPVRTAYGPGPLLSPLTVRRLSPVVLFLGPDLLLLFPTRFAARNVCGRIASRPYSASRLRGHFTRNEAVPATFELRNE